MSGVDQIHTLTRQYSYQLVREGQGRVTESERFETTVRPMGMPKVNLDRAIRIAAELEDREIIRRLDIGS